MIDDALIEKDQINVNRVTVCSEKHDANFKQKLTIYQTIMVNENNTEHMHFL